MHHVRGVLCNKNNAGVLTKIHSFLMHGQVTQVIYDELHGINELNIHSRIQREKKSNLRLCMDLILSELLISRLARISTDIWGGMPQWRGQRPREHYEMKIPMKIAQFQ